MIQRLSDIYERQMQIMATLADLDAEIKGELTTAIAAVDQKVTDLEAAIAAGSDTSAQIAELKALTANINATLNPPAPPAPTA